MKFRNVIRPSDLPTLFPLKDTLIYILLIKVFNIQGVWLGVFITFIVLHWIICAIAFGREKFTPVAFDENEEHKPNKFTQSDYEKLARELRKTK